MTEAPLQIAVIEDHLKDSDLNDTEKALLNILEDYSEEKSNSENTQRALLNILDDFTAERDNSEDTQRALLNILDDYRTEKENMENTQRAFLNILEDYSDEKKKAETTNEHLISANKENKELEQFAFVASHDLQEPLRTIINFAGLLEQKFAGKMDEETEEYLLYVVGAAAKMQNLIKELLELSRIGRNVEFETVDLNKVIETVLSDMANTIKESGAKITCSRLPVLTGNEVELARLFMNLISNAIKFAKNNTMPEINISAESREDSWLFSVHDNGIGIPKKYAEKVFVIFQRLHTIEEYPGTGIGLASCKKIVSMHNGKIWVDSDLGDGSTFYFTMPNRSGKN